jgi:hypothetical protein
MFGYLVTGTQGVISDALAYLISSCIHDIIKLRLLSIAQQNNETITIFMKLFIYFAFMLFIGDVLCKES